MRRTWLGTYIALFAFFAFLRFYHLTTRPMHNDEGVNGFFTNNLIKSGNWKYDPYNYHGPTLYYFQLFPSWVCEFLKQPTRFHFNDSSGLTVFTTRFTIACLGLLALAGFLFCRNILGRWGTLAALFLAGTSCDFLFYSRYFIHETHVVLFTFGFFLASYFLRKARRPLYFYLAVLSAALLFCTKETGVIHLGVLALAYLATNILNGLLDKTSPKKTARRMWNDAQQTWVVVKPHLPYAFVMALVVWGLLFTSFLKNPAGLWDSFATYLPWTKQSVESDHVKAWSYFIKDLLFAYELPLTVLTILGILIAFIKNEKRGLFLSFWALLMGGVYSAIPYKTPWCVINFIFPMALVSGYGIQSALDWIQSQTPTPQKRRALIAAGVLIFCLIAVAFRSTWIINYREYDNERHKQAYVHTSRDIFRLLGTIEEIGRKTGEGKTLSINNVLPEYWPLPFYLKDYPSAKFWGKIENVEPLDAPLVLAFSSQHSELKRRLKDSYSIQNFTLRPGVTLDLWVNNGFMEGTKLPQTVPELLSSANPTHLTSGLRYEVFAGTSCWGRPAREANGVNNIQFYFDSDSKKPLPSPFTIRWTGYLKIPQNGVYRFSTDSDDGSEILLDDSMIVDNSGDHPLRRKSRSVSLSAGYHKFELRYTDAGGFAELGVFWKPPQQQEERLPPQILFRPAR